MGCFEPDGVNADNSYDGFSTPPRLTRPVKLAVNQYLTVAIETQVAGAGENSGRY